MSDIEHIEEDKWYEFSRSETFICCDCCLVHKLKIKLKDGKVFTKWNRDDRATAAYRRGKENKAIIKKIAKKL